MSENEMGYRGSKSEFQIPQPNEISVKEQRVDGSYLGFNPKLRCTLMGCESSYQVNILSKTFKSYFSTINKPSSEEKKIIKLNPYFVSGLIDAEGYFTTSIYKDKKLKTGWRVKSSFEIGLNSQDSLLLYQLQEFFGGIGTFRIDKKANALKYSVGNIKDITSIIIPHFHKFPLLTQKAIDFLFFEKIIEKTNNNEHLTINGINEIINIKASMNLGISEILKSEFKNIQPIERPIISSDIIPDPN